MANFLCDVLRICSTNGTILQNTLRRRQFGLEQTYNRIGAKRTDGAMAWYWPRINNNVALRDHYVSNSGGNSGIRVSDTGDVTIIGGLSPELIFKNSFSTPRNWSFRSDGNEEFTGFYNDGTEQEWVRVQNYGGYNLTALNDYVGINGINNPLAPLHVKAGLNHDNIRVERNAGTEFGLIGMVDVSDGVSNIGDVCFYRDVVRLLYLTVCNTVGTVRIANAMDLHTDPWQTFAGSVVTGLEVAGLTKSVKYKKIGKMVFVSFYLAGTTTNPGGYISFTLPYQGHEDIQGFFPTNLLNNATWENGCLFLNYINSQSKIYVARSLDGSLSFSSAVAAKISGQFFYECI